MRDQRDQRRDAEANLTLGQAHPLPVALFCLLILGAAMAAAKVFSPQYLLWILPLAPLLPGLRRDDAGAGGITAITLALAFLALCALTTLIFPYHYWSDIVRLQPDNTTLLSPTPFGLALLALRNGLLVLILVSLSVILYRRCRSTSGRPLLNARAQPDSMD
jgi:hypothetical protein